MDEVLSFTHLTLRDFPLKRHLTESKTLQMHLQRQRVVSIPFIVGIIRVLVILYLILQFKMQYPELEIQPGILIDKLKDLHQATSASEAGGVHAFVKDFNHLKCIQICVVLFLCTPRCANLGTAPITVRANRLNVPNFGVIIARLGTLQELYLCELYQQLSMEHQVKHFLSKIIIFGEYSDATLMYIIYISLPSSSLLIGFSVESTLSTSRQQVGRNFSIFS